MRVREREREGEREKERGGECTLLKTLCALLSYIDYAFLNTSTVKSYHSTLFANSV